MAEAFLNTRTQRYAVVTGGNKGIGFHICKQLATKGITVVLTARDEKRGIEAQQSLEELGVVFHQLDVVDPTSVTRLADFIKTKFGKLDILVNNAGISGVRLEGDVSILQEVILESTASLTNDRAEPKAKGRVIENLKDAKECVETNYYGAKRTTEALDSTPTTIRFTKNHQCLLCIGKYKGENVAFVYIRKQNFVPITQFNFQLLHNEWAKGVLSDEENLSEEKIDEVVQNYLKSFEANQLSTQLSAYKVSKASMNAYTRLTARKHPSFCINCVCPGFTRTDITCNLGVLSAEEAAERPVEIALMPHGGPSGFFFLRKGISPF